MRVFDTPHGRISIKRLPTGWWHLRGKGPGNWVQLPAWPLNEELIRHYAFDEAGEPFLRAAVSVAIFEQRCGVCSGSGAVGQELCPGCHGEGMAP